MPCREKISVFLFTFAFAVLCSCQRTEVHTDFLHHNWEFRQSGTEEWFSAQVPGSAHLDILSNGFIEDPFFGNNETELQWIGENDWEYKTVFSGKRFLKRENIEIIFNGLDTYADVYLNDSLLFSADNMFRGWQMDIRKLLKKENNELYIRFIAPSAIEQEKASALHYSLPDIRGFTRKAPYQYGWDWGPKFVTSGIWQPVYIRTWDDARIENVHLIQQDLTDTLAIFTAAIEIVSSRVCNAEIEIHLDNPVVDLVESKIELQEGINEVNLDFIISDPELWWPNGMGDQSLYTVEIELRTPHDFDQKSIRTGIREVELIQEKDSIGESFYFKVNGQPMFAKGANYIPQDNFLSRVTDEKYEQTIQTAVDANMNMLRVWGGGIYENEIFYELCDEKGILIWQDFMFACNMYPGDSAFVENVKQEAIYQVKRLRNHPCLVLWCGNNEVDEGWFNWGWQKSLGYTQEDSTEVWNNYLNLFHEILPQTIATFSPDIPYVSSSPRIGWGHEEAMLQGDMHYWGVWWGEEPFEMYEHKVGRFMSEFGFQGFPDLNTLDSVLYPDNRKLESDALINHQKHPRGMELIQTYMAREYHVPEDFNQYAYVSQLVQAYGIKKALEAHRRAKPYCMGTLYWQLNDCWPAISWSSVDYYNRWKALHYFARDVFEDLTISFKEGKDSLDVFVISDLMGLFSANLEIAIIDFSGTSLWKDIIPISVKSNSSSVYYTFNLQEINIKSPLEDIVLKARLISNDNYVWRKDHYFFVKPKKLNLVEPVIQYKIHQSQYGRYIHIKTDNLTKNVYLSIDEGGHFTNNFFDLLPNDSIVVEFISDQDSFMDVKPLENFEERLKIISLIDTR